jgi:DNA-binding NarL/FixJ family response regulator
VATAATGQGTVVRLPVRVLVADDAGSIRELLTLLFDGEPDFQVVARAPDGAETLRLAAETRPDVIILDLSMPRLDGLGALPRLRALVPEARVVLFTGSLDAGLARQATAAGADAAIEKTVGVLTLVDSIRDIVRRPRAPAVRVAE